MSAPKSDTTTIEARKNRLLELLAEGKNQQQAADILSLEGYPADHRTIQRDVRSLRGQWGEANMNQYELLREQQLREVEEDKEELRGLRSRLDLFVDPREVIEWALKIIDRRDAIRQTEMKLTGTAAPTKSISANVNVEQQVIPMEQQLEYLNAFAGLYDDERLAELDRVKARRRTCRVVMDANVFQKALPESGS
jgi:hypothetical protein